MLLNGLMFLWFFSDILIRILLISKLIIPLKALTDNSFGAEIITLGQCANEL